MEPLALLEYSRISHTQSATLSPQFIQLLCTVQRLHTQRLHTQRLHTRLIHTLTVWIVLLASFSPLYAVNRAIALKREDTGPSVKALQQQLAAVGFYNGPFTDYYGELTEAAVIQFQQSQGLVADGIAGSATLNALGGSSSALNSASSRPSSQGRSSNGILKRESSGPQVVQLQDQLRTVGVFTDNSTGYFGSQTEAAVIQFQRNQGLTADGIAGSATLAALSTILSSGGALTPQADSAVTSGTSSGTSLRKESSGPRVKQLQEQLKAVGFFQDSTTEYFGTQTEQAVIAFQSSRGLTADGIVGAATLATLDSVGTVGPQATTPGQSTAALLARESSGAAVTQLQEKLKALGYFEGETTDFFGPKTEAAVIAFQSAQSLTADGIVGSATLSALNAGTAGISAAGISPTGTATLPSDGILRPSQGIQVGVETLQNKLQ
ncbi:MAG: peptidoglycan-binding protein, partial [Symploca sp. SIO2B6]|nr:peptidoglycan-binding protein [Symploca sp. SIO2B6]